MDQYYIGIDIGDGETAVAVLTEHSVSPQMLNLGYRDYSILSAVGTDASQRIVIGENVILLTGIQNQSVRFKSRFLTDVQAHDDLKRFVQGLLEALKTYSGFFGENNQLRMVVGCPTGKGWTTNARQRYAAVIRDGGLTIQESPVGESRAAFLYTKYGSDGNVPEKMLDGNVLVIDMGSSTTDLAYIVAGKDCTANVFGAAHLGGGLIDQMLLEQCVEAHPKKDELKAFFARTPGIRHRCEIKARRVKEQFFTAQARVASTAAAPEETEIIFYKGTRADFTHLNITTNKDSMTALLDAPLPQANKDGENPPPEKDAPTFRSSLNALLEDAVRQTSSNPPALIILTGGASRMPFLQDAVRTYFPDAIISCCEKPEYSIASGLAFTCRVDERMEKFRQAIQNFTNSPEFEKLLDPGLPSLINSLCDTLAPLFVDRLFMPAFSLYGHQLEQNGQATDWKATFFDDPAVKEAVVSCLQQWAGNGLRPLSERIRLMCQQYHVSTAQLPVPTPNQLHIELPPFELHAIINLLLQIPLIGAGVQAVLKPRYIKETHAAMKNLLQDRFGLFYTGLRSELKTTLKTEIDERAKKVEIPIV